MIQTTICFLMRDDHILLAMKKRGHGEGKWNGVGGKAGDGESIKETAIREAEEEIGVTPLNLVKVASIKFEFPPERNFDHESTVFFCDSWEGEPTETEEMRPRWFRKDEIPYDEMWQDDAIWLPKVLEGNLITAVVKSGAGDVMEHYTEDKIDSFEDD